MLFSSNYEIYSDQTKPAFDLLPPDELPWNVEDATTSANNFESTTTTTTTSTTEETTTPEPVPLPEFSPAKV